MFIFIQWSKRSVIVINRAEAGDLSQNRCAVNGSLNKHTGNRRNSHFEVDGFWPTKKC
jgi:hypothetical protein